MNKEWFKYEDIRHKIRDLDVIAFEGRGVISKGIQLITGGKVSHVGLALWHGETLMLLESRELRGHRMVWLSREIETAKYVRWFTPKPYIHPVDRQRAVEWAIRASGAPYSYIGCWRFVRRLNPFYDYTAPDNFDYGPRMCSEFVSTVYQMAGVDLTPELADSAVSPAKLVQSASLYEMGTVYVPSETEVNVPPESYWTVSGTVRSCELRNQRH